MFHLIRSLTLDPDIEYQPLKPRANRRTNAIPENLARVEALNQIAQSRGQTLAQMAVVWTLRDPRVTAALVGASRWSQIEDILQALDGPKFSTEELDEIDLYAVDANINLWAISSEASEDQR